MLPHAPHTPPDDLLQKYLKLAPSESVARYWACVEWFDRTCGELLDRLDPADLRTNTIVIYTTDNGWRQHPDRPDQFAPRSKLTPYEGGVRTPIMISWPGTLKPRRDAEHLASNVDLWPTLGALLHTATPPTLPGINLTDARAVSRRARIFGETFGHQITDVEAPTRSLQTRWIIDGWWKLIVRVTPNPGDNRLELYDLRHDPWEKADLAGREPARTRKLAGRLDTWWTPD
jgi:arylsulfatase A-like enzyme